MTDADAYVPTVMRLAGREVDRGLREGTCLLCGLPMRLHPPERLRTADPSLCPDVGGTR